MNQGLLTHQSKLPKIQLQFRTNLPKILRELINGQQEEELTKRVVGQDELHQLVELDVGVDAGRAVSVRARDRGRGVTGRPARGEGWPSCGCRRGRSSP